jgi:hypothetical protein
MNRFWVWRLYDCYKWTKICYTEFCNKSCLGQVALSTDCLSSRKYVHGINQRNSPDIYIYISIYIYIYIYMFVFVYHWIMMLVFANMLEFLHLPIFNYANFHLFVELLF